MLEETDKAYLAGLIDGDGSISLFSMNEWQTTSCRVVIEMLAPEGINSVYEQFGGRLTTKANGLLSLMWNGTHCKPILQAVLPYLKVKRGQAELVLEFLAAPDRRTRAGREWKKTHDAKVLERKCRELNGRYHVISVRDADALQAKKARRGDPGLDRIHTRIAEGSTSAEGQRTPMQNMSQEDTMEEDGDEI